MIPPDVIRLVEKADGCSCLDAIDAPHKFVLGQDDDLYLPDTEPQPWAEPDEGATARPSYEAISFSIQARFSFRRSLCLRNSSARSDT